MARKGNHHAAETAEAAGSRRREILREIDDIRRRIPDLEEATAARARSENTFDAYATGELSRVSGEAAEE